MLFTSRMQFDTKPTRGTKSRMPEDRRADPASRQPSQAAGHPAPYSPDEFGTPAEVVRQWTRPDGVTVLNADSLASEHPAFVGAKSLGEALKIAHELHAVARLARDAAFAEALRQSRPSPKVLLTAGGAGSGKSTLIDSQPPGTLVLDTNLLDANQARRWVAQIRAAGKQPRIVYVHREFAEAVRANLRRAMDVRRAVGAAGMASAHTKARTVILDLVDTAADAPIQINRNVQDQGYELMTPDELRSLPRPTVDERLREAQDIADAIRLGTDPNWAGGTLPSAVHRYFTGRDSELRRGHGADAEGSELEDRGGRASTDCGAQGDSGSVDEALGAASPLKLLPPSPRALRFRRAVSEMTRRKLTAEEARKQSAGQSPASTRTSSPPIWRKPGARKSPIMPSTATRRRAARWANPKRSFSAMSRPRWSHSSRGCSTTSSVTIAR